MKSEEGQESAACKSINTNLSKTNIKESLTSFFFFT